MKNWSIALLAAALLGAPSASYAREKPRSSSQGTRCEGEPRRYGQCNPRDAHVQCFLLENPHDAAKRCNIVLKASMRSPTGFERLYTAVEHALVLADDSSWLCFSFDRILQSTGGNPWQWEMVAIHDPEMSCADDEDEPLCSVEELSEGTCDDNEEEENKPPARGGQDWGREDRHK